MNSIIKSLKLILSFIVIHVDTTKLHRILRHMLSLSTFHQFKFALALGLIASTNSTNRNDLK